LKIDNSKNIENKKNEVNKKVELRKKEIEELKEKDRLREVLKKSMKKVKNYVIRKIEEKPETKKFEGKKKKSSHIQCQV